MAIDSFLPPKSNGTAPPTVIRKEQDFFLKKMVIVAYNGAEYEIADHRIIFEYTEDIFQNCTTGTLILLDAVDLAHCMPILGEEKVKVVLSRQNEEGKGLEGSLLEDLELNFRVFHISGREEKNPKVQVYTLHLISDTYFNNLTKKVYKGWKSKPYSTMIEDIYNTYIKTSKPIVIEPTKYEHDFCIGNVPPFELVNTLASRCISDEGNGELYVFYEDKDQFNFTSIGKLMMQPSKETYIYGPRKILEPGSPNFAYKQLPIENEVKNIEHYHWNQQADILTNIKTGMYGQTVHTIDIVRQISEKIEFKLKDEFDSFPRLDKEKFFTDTNEGLESTEAHIKFMSTNKDHDIVEHLTAKDPTIKPNKLEEYVHRRGSHLHQLNNFRIGVVVSGDPRRKVGDIITFELPQVAGDVRPGVPQELDKFVQGKYLVLSIKHSLSQIGYNMSMELVKDSFFKPVEHVDVIEKYKPTY